MPASSRTPQRRPRASRTAVATGALLLALAGCSGAQAPAQRPAVPTAESTSLGDYDTADLALVREAFCDRVADGAVTAALDGEPVDSKTWRPGNRLPDSADISNEFGCSWTSGSLRAAAWVFAPPIAAPRAADFASEAVGQKCERLRKAPELGRPSVAQRCGGAKTTALAGLVGDTWVGCEISGLPVANGIGTARVGAWCVAVLDALRSA